MGAIRRIAQEMLANADAEISASEHHQRISRGIGYRQIMEKLGEGHDRQEIESALALLKQSGDYDRVVREIAKYDAQAKDKHGRGKGVENLPHPIRGTSKPAMPPVKLWVSPGRPWTLRRACSRRATTRYSLVTPW